MKHALALDAVFALLLWQAIHWRHQQEWSLCLLALAVPLAWKNRQRLQPSRIVLILLVGLTLGVELIAPHDPLAKVAQGDIMGLDRLSRDHFSRLLYGNRNTAIIAFLGSLGAMFLGTIMAAVLAQGPDLVRKLLAYLIQGWLAVPVILILFLGLALVDSGGPLTLITIFSLVQWPEPARLLQARIDELNDKDFVNVARMSGSGETRIFIKEVLPNLRTVWLVNFLVTFISSVLLESAVGFLGLGLSVGTPSLGHLIEYGARNMDHQPLILAASIGMLMLWVQCLRAILKQLGAPKDSLE